MRNWKYFSILLHKHAIKFDIAKQNKKRYRRFGCAGGIYRFCWIKPISQIFPNPILRTDYQFYTAFVKLSRRTHLVRTTRKNNMHTLNPKYQRIAKLRRTHAKFEKTKNYLPWVTVFHKSRLHFKATNNFLYIITKQTNYCCENIVFATKRFDVKKTDLRRQHFRLTCDLCLKKRHWRWTILKRQETCWRQNQFCLHQWKSC